MMLANFSIQQTHTATLVQQPGICSLLMMYSAIAAIESGPLCLSELVCINTDHQPAKCHSICMLAGGRDIISADADIALLKQALQPGVLQLHHHQPDYAHLDFELGTDAPTTVYPELLDLVLRFTGR